MHSIKCVCGGCGKEVPMWEDGARFLRASDGVWMVCSRACVTALAGQFALSEERETVRTADQVQNSPFRLQYVGNSVGLGLETLRCATCDSRLQWSFVPDEQRFRIQPCTACGPQPACG